MEFMPGLHPWGMKQISQISIPQPCTQTWDNMLPGNDGRFCDSCQKHVTDFTNLSNNEVIAILSSANKVCGRFSETQLLVLNDDLAPRSSMLLWQKFGLAAMFISFVPFAKTIAQVKPSVKRHYQTIAPAIPKMRSWIGFKKITGRVIDNVSKLPLSAVSVKINKEEGYVMTDTAGYFTLNIIPDQDTVLRCTYVGYRVGNIKLNKLQSNYNIELVQENAFAINEPTLTCTVGGICVRYNLRWRIYYAITRPFRKLFRSM